VETANATIDSCLLGHAKMDILCGDVRLQFGKYNYRPLHTGEGRKLYLSMLENGIQRFDVKNAIPLIAKREYVNLDVLSTDARPSPATLKEVEWTELATTKGFNKIIAPGGRHWHFTLQTYCEPMKRDFDRLERIQLNVSKKVAPDSAKYLGAKMKTNLAEKAYHNAALWIVSIYDEGTYSTLSAM
jgi:hypothetical protein